MLEANSGVSTRNRGQKRAIWSRGVREIDGGGGFEALNGRRDLLNGCGVVDFRGIQRGSTESSMASSG